MIALAIFVALVVIQDRPASAEQPIEMTLERTRCFGMCPAYKVTIDGEGNVTYEGRASVRVTGRQTARIPREAVEALLREFRSIDFFSLKDEYSALVTDLPTTYVTLRQGDRVKRIKDYVGAPRALRELEEDIDRAAAVSRWVRIDAVTVKEMVRSGWRANGDDGRQLLRTALQYDETDVVEALIDAGADVNAPPLPLLAARSARAVRLLVGAGANVHARNGAGPTVVWMSVHKAPEVTRALLEAGAPADDSMFEPPLLSAACNGNAEAVDALLKAGAAPDRADSSGKTPRQCAENASRQPDHPPLFPERQPFVKDFARVLALLNEAIARKRQ